MTDPIRRRAPDDVERRVTILETQFSAMGRRIDEHMLADSEVHRDIRILISRLDERADRTDVLFGRLIGALIIVQALVILLSPTIRAAFGLVPA